MRLTTANPAEQASLYSFTALTSLYADHSTVSDIGSADLPPEAAFANLCTLEIRDTDFMAKLELFTCVVLLL
ncbi:hypothetical protein EXIGLDRAFT_717669 [Exidia glandulosa HHB12029]|uniref:Uncharacterized protein n=1 Tax=Exidia glandulosa HHB12029 TaxID=1314781 RepID=A0A165I7R4_EXIGL|nr:hypothetical protein EXIGLDRAFT_717669 [Exidia glandulosa HHB12029]